MKKQYIVPQTSVVATNPAGLICHSTKTEDNTGGNTTGPDMGNNQEKAAKKNNFNVWTDDEETDDWGSI